MYEYIDYETVTTSSQNFLNNLICKPYKSFHVGMFYKVSLFTSVKSSQKALLQRITL